MIGQRRSMHFLLRLAVLPAVVGVTAFAVPAPASAETVRGYEWHIGALKISQAQQISRGNGVTVAVIDTGVDPSTPSLRGRLLSGAQFGVPASPNGLVDTDQHGHGTAMSGIIAGRGGGPNDMLGIAPGVKILPVSVGTDDDIADGLRWAVNHGAKVVNISKAGGHEPIPSLVSAVKYAQSRDVVVVAGAGNTGETGVDVGSPARIPGIVAVSGTDRAANFWQGSSRGPQVAIAAPGIKIIAPVPKRVNADGYLLTNGTSSSTAIVSGVVALIRSKYPSLNAPSVINRLIRTAKDQGAPGRDQYFGFGTVDVLAALTRSVPPVTTNPLGAPATAASAAPSEATPSPTRRQSQGLGLSIDPVGATIWGVLLLLAIVAVVVVIIVVRRSTRRRPPPGPPGSWPAPTGRPPG